MCSRPCAEVEGNPWKRDPRRNEMKCTRRKRSVSHCSGAVIALGTLHAVAGDVAYASASEANR
jgi:hypothetical protein